MAPSTEHSVDASHRLLALAVGFSVLVSSCGSRPQVREYLIAARGLNNQAEPAPAGTQAGTISIASFEVRPFLDRTGIAYRRGDVEAGFYKNDRWAEPLREMLLQWFLQELRDSGSFAAVFDPYEHRPADLEIAVLVTGFHGYVDAGEFWAVAALELSIKAGTRIERIPLRQTEVAEGRDVRALVEALQRGGNALLERARMQLLTVFAQAGR